MVQIEIWVNRIERAFRDNDGVFFSPELHFSPQFQKLRTHLKEINKINMDLACEAYVCKILVD
jgi:hypothetical protein